MSIAPVFILLFGISIGIPVAIAIGIAALSFFLISGAMPPELFVQRAVAITHSFPLLAVPLRPQKAAPPVLPRGPPQQLPLRL